jgi:hypothetical protein
MDFTDGFGRRERQGSHPEGVPHPGIDQDTDSSWKLMGQILTCARKPVVVAHQLNQRRVVDQTGPIADPP